MSRGGTTESATKAWRTKYAKQTPIMRWVSCVEMPTHEGGCWLWRGRSLPRGYGRLLVNHRPVSAHRFSWMAFNGPIPDGLYVLHRCDVRNCVNPSHLFLGDAGDNIRDCVEKGRNQYASKTHCPKGHEYTPENTYRCRRGHRTCLTCKRAQKRAWDEVQRERLKIRRAA